VWLARAANPSIAVRATGGDAEVDAFVVASPGRGTFDTLRARVDHLRANIDAAVAAETARTTAVRNTLSWWLGALLTLGLVAVVLAVVGVRRSVTRPLSELVEAVSAVGRGDLDRPVVIRGPAEFVTVSRSVDHMRRMLNDHRRAAVEAAAQEAKLRESERVAAELREGVVRRLFTISTALARIVNRHPAAGAEVLRCVRDIDETIVDVREAAVGRLASTTGKDVVVRIVDVLESARDLLGVDPTVRVTGTPRDDVGGGGGDVLVAGLRDTLSDLAAQGGVEALEVEVFSDAMGPGMRITVTGPVRGRTWSIVERAARAGGRCSVTSPDDHHTVLEWVLGPDDTTGVAGHRTSGSELDQRS